MNHSKNIEGIIEDETEQPLPLLIHPSPILSLSLSFISGPRIAAILLPTFILVLNSSNPTPLSTYLHTLSVNHLLSLASTQQAAFRQATASLDADRRTILETSIRNALVSNFPTSDRKGAPTLNSQREIKAKEGISLRSFG